MKTTKKPVTDRQRLFWTIIVLLIVGALIAGPHPSELWQTKAPVMCQTDYCP